MVPEGERPGRWRRAGALVAVSVLALLAPLLAAPAPSTAGAAPTDTRWADMVASLLPITDLAASDNPWSASLSADGTWVSLIAPPLGGGNEVRYGYGTPDRVASIDGGEPMEGFGVATSVQGLSPTAARVAFTFQPRPDGIACNGSMLQCSRVYLRDDGLDRLVLLSPAPDPDVVHHWSPSLAADARAVAFTSEGPGLLPEDDDDAVDVYVAEVDDAGDVALELVSVDGSGANRPLNAISEAHAISADGRYVAFTTYDPMGLLDGNATADVYVRDRVAGTTTLASRRWDGFATGRADDGVISDDGEVVAFATDATPVADGTDGRGRRQVYALERATGEVALASGLPGTSLGGDDDSYAPVLDADGGTVAFTTAAVDLVDAAAGPPVSSVDGDSREMLVVHLREGFGHDEPRNAALEVLAPTRLGDPARPVRSLAYDLVEGRGLVYADDVMVPGDTDGYADVFRFDVAEPWCAPALIQQGPGPFCDDISWAVANGILSLYEPGSAGGFEPLRPTTRQAMAAVTYRLAGEPLGADPACSDPPFPDVPVGAELCGEIAWMADQGLTTGYADGTFRPAEPVSRQAMLAFLWRLEGEPDSPFCPGPPFPDVPTGHAFCEAIGWGADAGITTGYVDGTFHTTAPVSRQATAAFTFRATLHRGEA